MGFHHVGRDGLDLLTLRSTCLGLPKYYTYITPTLSCLTAWLDSPLTLKRLLCARVGPSPCEAHRAESVFTEHQEQGHWTFPVEEPHGSPA
ncbi:hypothetical protein AAY473_007748 [Plecturocebus cupreus]